MSTKDGCAAVHVHVWYLQLRRTSVTWRSNFRAESSVKPRSDWQVSGASFLAPENLCKKTCASYTFTLRKFLVQESGYTPKILCYNKESLEKSDLQSIVQSAAEFHDRNLPEIEHVLFLPVSGASFLYQKNGARNPVDTGKFSVARNLRQKLAIWTRLNTKQLDSVVERNYRPCHINATCHWNLSRWALVPNRTASVLAGLRISPFSVNHRATSSTHSETALKVTSAHSRTATYSCVSSAYWRLHRLCAATTSPTGDVHGEQQWSEQTALRKAGRAARWFGLFTANCDALLPVGDKELQPAEGSTTDVKRTRTSIDKAAVVYRVECRGNIQRYTGSMDGMHRTLKHLGKVMILQRHGEHWFRHLWLICCENWTTKKDNEMRLEAFEITGLRNINILQVSGDIESQEIKWRFCKKPTLKDSFYMIVKEQENWRN